MIDCMILTIELIDADHNLMIAPTVSAKQAFSDLRELIQHHVHS